MPEYPSRRSVLCGLAVGATASLAGCESLPFQSTELRIETGPADFTWPDNIQHQDGPPTFRAAYITERAAMQELVNLDRANKSVLSFLEETNFGHDAILRVDILGIQSLNTLQSSVNANIDKISVRYEIDRLIERPSGFAEYYRIMQANGKISPPITLQVRVERDSSPDIQAEEAVSANRFKVFSGRAL